MIDIQEYNSKKETLDSFPEMVKEIFGIAESVVLGQLRAVLDKFINNIIIIVEYPYVDKYYRDTYYNFFSKKHMPHQRDSIRMSFFYNSVELSDFVDATKIEDIQKAFLGVITIRPTSVHIIGHSFISPKILNDRSFVSCLCNEKVSICGVELSVYGFPFCSQDIESTTCAESALLMLVNYFSNKFSEYPQLLPSKINDILKSRSYERQLPSIGLEEEDISFVLKELGFGAKIYSKEAFEEESLFKRLIYIYIESGIPVILTLEDDNRERHAVVAIGREEVKDRTLLDIEYTNNKVYFPDLFDKILLMNDNNTPYELVSYNCPVPGSSYQVYSFIIPLHCKIYSDAYQFLNHFDAIIKEFSENKHTKKVLSDESQNSIIRYFLTTSRSYKSHIINSHGVTSDFKTLFVDKSMPKFIWVAEIMSGNKLVSNEQCVNTVVILDATESGLSGNLIIAFNSENVVFKNFVDEERLYSVIEIKTGEVNTFKNNLKGKHTQWLTQS
jgi:hypothetical protein